MIGTIIGIIAVIIAIAIEVERHREHRHRTGVHAPSTNAQRRIRRNARRKGISEDEAYGTWLSWHQKRNRVGPHSASGRLNTDALYPNSSKPPRRDFAQEHRDQIKDQMRQQEIKAQLDEEIRLKEEKRSNSVPGIPYSERQKIALNQNEKASEKLKSLSGPKPPYKVMEN